MLRIKTYNPSPGKAGGWGLWTWDQPGSYSKTLTQNENSQISRGTFSRSLSFYFYIMNHIYLLIHFLKFRYIFISFIFYINYLKHMELVRKVMNNKTENISNSRSALTVCSESIPTYMLSSIFIIIIIIFMLFSWRIKAIIKLN